MKYRKSEQKTNTKSVKIFLLKNKQNGTTGPTNQKEKGNTHMNKTRDQKGNIILK